MKSKSALSLSLLLALSCLAPVALAQKDPGVTVSKADYVQMRDDVVAGLEPGGEYAHLTERQKRNVRQHLARMDALMESVEHTGDLRMEQKVRFFNHQSDVNGLLTAVQKEDRVTCRREHAVGSNRPVGRCFTAKEREAAANNAREQMLNSLQRGQVKDF